MTHQFLDVYFLVIVLGVTGEYFDISRHGLLSRITENTRVVDIFLENNSVFLSNLGNSTSWTYPTGCHPAKRRFLEQYCVVGTYTTSDTISIALDLYIYDANDNTKTVIVGITSVFRNADPINMTGYAYGCADLLDQTLSYGSVHGIVHACMSGGGKGTYDPVTKQYTVPSHIVTNVTLSGFGHELLNDKYTLQGYYRSGLDFDMGLDASVGRQVKSDGMYSGSMSFDVSFSTVANDIFAWHVFAGIHASAQLLDFRPAYASYPFVDIILNIKP